MKEFISLPYVFTPGASNVGTLNLSSIVGFNSARLLAVLNQTKNSIIYAPTMSGYGIYSVVGNTVSFQADTSSMSSSDVLLIQYDSIESRVGNSQISDSFRDNLAALDTTNNWNQVATATNDLVMIEGNSFGCTYLTVSLDPFTEGSSTILETIQTWNGPTKIGIAASMSQRTVGQEVSFEWIDTNTRETSISSLSISTIQQTTTVLSITTTINHGLKVGDRISINGVSDSRLNYTNLVIATIVSPNSFTCTAGSMGTITSVTAGPFSVGTIYYRPMLSYAVDGTSMVFDSITATNACIFAKSGGQGAFPSGTPGGSQSATVGTSASTVVLSSYKSYNFKASTLYELFHQAEFIEWEDKSIDSTTVGYNSRYKTEQVIPDLDKKYKLRIKCNNNYGSTHPICQVVSAVKSGSTTATITTDIAHGLSITDYVNIFGIYDQTNFINLSVATLVASIINSTSFTIVIPTSATATSYGGFVSRCNGSQVQQGSVALPIQSFNRTSNIITLIATGTWSGIVIGDNVNLIGVRNITNGGTLSVDGSYRVMNLATTTLTLEPIGSAPTGSDIGTTNCGGGIVKRTDLRLDFVRINPFTRLITESYGSTNKNTVSSSLPVTVTASTTLAITGISPTAMGGQGTSNKSLPVYQSAAGSTASYAAQAWAAASGNGATLTNEIGTTAAYDINLTAWTVGTSTGLVVALQWSPDNGTTFYDIWMTEPMTATGHIFIPAIPIVGRVRMRWFHVSGSATTATVTVTAMNGSTVVPMQYQYFDRTASVGSGTASTSTNSASYLIQGAKAFTVVMNAGTATGVGSFKVQMSIDGINWYDAGAATTILSTSANLTILPITSGIYGRFLRVQCTAGGTTQLLNAIHILATS